ncbi:MULTISPECIES: carbohydrate ABC transporter permease [Nesterenkonia]|uniref:Raffinose/stachyose/melibiose transport system permease protein n=1 Tax=Nesterenkonia sandarakina TaxID=272918 RepID=A0A2T0YQP0_9MICC|nr:sugar ABC transporter permease [Nesterenkonia sandarakina]MBO0595467.1 sugar ABC transporter permease [Nesterenkonia sp. E16_10]MBO0599085.1 sugar ABC transporter permease [Nesterenkonia sp. E16_7]PRZ17734.1 raffinose/stachyose/melibiose transport system permease protein [Nesterenkonia sandarakina]
MALPAVLFFGIFALIPLIGVVVISFMEWNVLGSPTWVGLSNWQAVLFDRPFTWTALGLTITFVIGSYLFQAPVALLLGVFMAGQQRYRALLAVLYFLPLLFSSVAVGLTFQSLFSPNYGLSAALPFEWLPNDWLSNSDLVMWVMIFVVGWCFVPFHGLLYQAGVRQIPQSMYEAATIDGAGRVRQFFSITIPQLRYTIITSSTLMLVGSLTYFDLIFVLTGGQPADAVRILPLDMYVTGFSSYNLGYASVIAVILVAIGLTLSLALNIISGSSKMESDKAGA